MNFLNLLKMILSKYEIFHIGMIKKVNISDLLLMDVFFVLCDFRLPAMLRDISRRHMVIGATQTLVLI